MRTIVGLACVLALVASAALSDTARGRSDPIRIGVMLPLSGPDAVSSQLPLSWAQENVNAGGGINGRRIEFVYRDLAYEPALAVARSFASDKSVTAVIGPDNSEDGRQVTSTLIDHRKVVVSPSATSADLFRAYSSKNPRYFWRPVESDIGQVRTMLNLAAQGGAKSVALMTGDSEYGNTFFNWFGFLATEMGLRSRLPSATTRARSPVSASRARLWPAGLMRCWPCPTAPSRPRASPGSTGQPGLPGASSSPMPLRTLP